MPGSAANRTETAMDLDDMKRVAKTMVESGGFVPDAVTSTPWLLATGPALGPMNSIASQSGAKRQLHRAPTGEPANRPAHRVVRNRHCRRSRMRPLPLFRPGRGRRHASNPRGDRTRMGHTRPERRLRDPTGNSPNRHHRLVRRRDRCSRCHDCRHAGPLAPL